MEESSIDEASPQNCPNSNIECAGVLLSHEKGSACIATVNTQIEKIVQKYQLTQKEEQEGQQQKLQETLQSVGDIKDSTDITLDAKTHLTTQISSDIFSERPPSYGNEQLSSSSEAEKLLEGRNEVDMLPGNVNSVEVLSGVQRTVVEETIIVHPCPAISSETQSVLEQFTPSSETLDQREPFRVASGADDVSLPDESMCEEKEEESLTPNEQNAGRSEEDIKPE